MNQKVLIIDDSKTVHSLVRSRLHDEPVDIYSAYGGDSGLALALTLQPDVILLDVEMPQPDGFEVCRRLKADPATMGIPVIFLTGVSSTQQMVQGLELGATDYVTKPFDPSELRARVRASLRTKYLVDLLAKKAMIDGLTGLWNRAYLDQRLAAEIAAAKRWERPLSLVMADVDNFKSINDRYGHPFGDEVLRVIGLLFLENSRAEDVVCRYGGEEFSILTPGVTGEGAEAHADRLRQTIAERKFTRGGVTINVTCSFGVSPAVEPSQLAIQVADKALYEAKAGGRNRVVRAA